MRDLSGVISTWDHMKTLTTTQSTSPSFLLQLQKSHRPDCKCLQVSSGTFIPTNPVCQLLTCLQTAQLTEAHGISDPFVKNRHTFHQDFTDICAAPRSSQKAFFHSFATVFRQPFGRNLFGLPEVFNKRHSAFRCIFQTSSTLRKRLLSSRELSFFFFFFLKPW